MRKEEVQSKTITIALLIADSPPFGNYHEIYTNFLSNALSSIPRHDWQERIALEIIPFNVHNHKELNYPKEEELKQGRFDAIFITGSASSAYLDQEWTNKLSDFITHVVEDHPLIRILGICYGHQIVARALGGKVELNPKGWELGTYESQVNEDGQEWLGFEEGETLSLQQVHRDIVTSIPSTYSSETLFNLASTSICPIQSLLLPYPSESPPLPSIAETSTFIPFDVSPFSSALPSKIRGAHVFTVQGHPEFDKEIVEKCLELKTEMGSFEGDKEEAKRRIGGRNDGERIGKIMLNMLGVESRNEGGDLM